jgi:KaiC/GvpD/RAD55 family RecA-like ATPase
MQLLMFDMAGQNLTIERILVACLWHFALLVFEMECSNGTIERPWLEALLPDIVQAGFDGNIRRLEVLAITAIRSARRNSPELAANLDAILSSRRFSARATRSLTIEPSPIDRESSAPLLKIETPVNAPRPIFRADLQSQVDRFLNERRQSDRLLGEGFLPPRSILITGPPGTGKTMFAKWLAGDLKLNFATLDLATSISSYLGKTGMNLRRALDYARATPCLLLLDEFDAVAKRRDDPSEVGELKRIVNVLLKELEDWPAHSLLVAATNHPDLLDSAIARRFDRLFATEVPAQAERLSILTNSLARFGSEVKHEILAVVAEMLDGRSGSDVHSVGTAAVRRRIVEEERMETALASETRPFIDGGRKKQKAVGNFVRALKRSGGDSRSIRDIATITGLVPSTVHYHLMKDSNDAGESTSAHIG